MLTPFITWERAVEKSTKSSEWSKQDSWCLKGPPSWQRAEHLSIMIIIRNISTTMHHSNKTYTLFFIRTSYFWLRLSCSYFLNSILTCFQPWPPLSFCLKCFLWSPLFVFLINLHLVWIFFKIPISKYQIWGCKSCS